MYEKKKSDQSPYAGDDSKTRTLVKKTVVERLSPILKKQGFVKVGYSFLRIREDRVLQSISYMYSARLVCCLTVDVQPLYMINAYAELEKKSKTLVKKYPIRLFDEI